MMTVSGRNDVHPCRLLPAAFSGCEGAGLQW